MDFKELVKIQVKRIEEETIIHYPEIEDLCWRPYPKHPKGCPNRHKCDWLNIPSFDVILDYGNFEFFYLIYAEFNFLKYKELRKKNRPDWTEKQIECVLYWQGAIKKQLSDFINYLPLTDEDFILGCGSGLKIKIQDRTGSMENSCINVFSTCKLNGIKLEIHPRNKIYLVCLLCSKEPLLTRSIKKQLLITESP